MDDINNFPDPREYLFLGRNDAFTMLLLVSFYHQYKTIEDDGMIGSSLFSNIQNEN